MKHGKFWSVAGGIALLAAALPAAGADLLSVFDQAVTNDPQIREAEANRLATREARPQAWAALMPSLSAGGGRSKSWSDSSGFSEIPIVDPVTQQLIRVDNQTSGGSGSGTSTNWSLSLGQTIFSLPTYVALATANRQVAQGEVDYLAAQQELVQRVARQYFAVLQAQDNVRAQEAARDAYTRQFEQAEQRFEVGLYAITEVQEARAARDNAAANVIGSRRSLSSAEEQLRATIGELPGSLNEPSDTMPLLSPDPAEADAWVKSAMEGNASLNSSRLAADIARDAVRSSFGSAMPTVSLSAGKNFSNSNSDRDGVGDRTYASDSRTNGKSIGLNFSMNLSGLGLGNYSRTTQSQQRWIAAKERLERVSRDTERQARDAYLGVISDIARVQALRQALESSQTALTATEAGMEVGTRTIVDVLNSRRQLIDAETSYSGAKYQYLNDLISLQLASGNLDRSTLEKINGWLTPPAPAPAAP